MLIAQTKVETEMSSTVVSIDTINFVSSILSDAREYNLNLPKKQFNRDCSLNKNMCCEYASCCQDPCWKRVSGLGYRAWNALNHHRVDPERNRMETSVF